MGVDKTLNMLRKNPEPVHRLCKIRWRRSRPTRPRRWTSALRRRFRSLCPPATVVSPKHFREFSLPYLKELVDFIKGRGKGVIIHICGLTSKIWEDVAALGVSGLSIDNVASIADCKRLVGDKVKILGNVDPGA